MSPARAILLLSLVLTSGMPDGAAAHDRGTSYSDWRIEGRRARVVVRIAELDVSRFPWATGAGGRLDRLLGRYLAQRLQLSAGGAPCEPTESPVRLESPPGIMTFEWQLQCPEGPLRMRSDILADRSPAHLHFARVERAGETTGSRERDEAVLAERRRAWALDAGAEGSAGAGLGDYVALGIDHILTGYDHLAFLFALLLIAETLPQVAKIVTGFTVGHSLTLGAMVLGYVEPQIAPIEALIGLSIALVAAENAWLQGGKPRGLPWAIAAGLAVLGALATLDYGTVPAITLFGLASFVAGYFALAERRTKIGSLRWGVAFLFGLIHGFGFAAMLGEAGLTADRVVVALFGFNAGVEIGQLAIVAIAWPLLLWVTHRRRPFWRAAITEGASSLVLALGVYWFVSRSYF